MFFYFYVAFGVYIKGDSITINGITGTYWQICTTTYNKDTNKTAAILRCYISSTVRQEGLDHYIDMAAFKKRVEFVGNLSVSELYIEIKKSVMSESYTDPYNGRVTEPVELNWFADSTDI